MKEILEHTIAYLKKTIPDFKKSGKVFTCPSCKAIPISCAFITDYSFIMDCTKCGFNGEITDLIDPDKSTALARIRDELKLEIKTNSELDNLLKFYVDNKFDLVPVQKNNKIPMEKDWTNKNHRRPDEWKMWFERNLNAGVKTGKISNITVIDIDDPDLITEEIQKLFNETCSQTTNKGIHYFYQYEPELAKTRIENYKIDVENDGGQVVIEPSVIDGVRRTVNQKPIAKMSVELKTWLLKNGKGVSGTTVEMLRQQADSDDLNLAAIPDGGRHHILMKIGGTLRKELNTKNLEYTLSVLNQLACKPKLDRKEFSDIIASLGRYDDFDEKDLSRTILRYIEIVEECGWRDIKEALGFPKERIDKVLKYLEKEGFLIKKQRMYHLIKRAEWRDTWMEESDPLDIKIPYLHDTGTVRNGDLILIGGKSGTGKTHIAMNMIKLLVDQGVIPYYISLESGSRFSLIAGELGLREGQFRWATHFSPESIELEPNVITVLDWLLPKDYASTDKTYEHFAKQLVKQGGVLIVFCQLRRDGTFFAEDMIKFFPSIVAKFLYESEDNGATSCFETVKLRESKSGRQNIKVPCVYDWVEKRLTRKDGLDISDKK